MSYTRDEIERARHVNVVTVMEALGHQMTRHSQRECCWAEHDSFKAERDGFRWYWNSRGLFGNTVDLLMKCFGYSFYSAVQKILEIEKETAGIESGRMLSSNAVESDHRNKNVRFVLPRRNYSSSQLIKYLCEVRMIDEQLIRQCIEEELIYEEVYRKADGSSNFHNAVFIGRNERGQACYAFRRGMQLERKFAGDVIGSDKRYAFRLDGRSETVHVFEAAIDSLSYKTLYPDCEDCLLSLGGSSLLPLKHLFNTRTIAEIIVSTDSDSAGDKIYRSILEQFKDRCSVVRDAPENKDFNVDLVLQKGGSLYECREVRCRCETA